MPTYNVYGRVRVDYEFSEVVEANSEESAIKKTNKKIYGRLGISGNDILDDEIYCNKIKIIEEE